MHFVDLNWPFLTTLTYPLSLLVCTGHQPRPFPPWVCWSKTYTYSRLTASKGSASVHWASQGWWQHIKCGPLAWGVGWNQSQVHQLQWSATSLSKPPSSSTVNWLSSSLAAKHEGLMPLARTTQTRQELRLHSSGAPCLRITAIFRAYDVPKYLRVMACFRAPHVPQSLITGYHKLCSPACLYTLLTVINICQRLTWFPLHVL